MKRFGLTIGLGEAVGPDRAGSAPKRFTTREAVQIFSLKGDQISAQGFNPGLGRSRRCALKGHQNAARDNGSKSIARVSSYSRHFQGAFLRGEHPGLKPWAKPFCPLGAQSTCVIPES